MLLPPLRDALFGSRTPSFVLSLAAKAGAMPDMAFNAAWAKANGTMWKNGLLVPVTSVLSCTRASSKLAKNSAGSLETFSSNVLAITDLGLSAHEGRTNIALRSSGVDNASWNKDGTTVSADAVAAPDGTTTADKLVETATTAPHLIYQTITVSNATVYTWSVYAKKAERDWIAVDAADNGGDHYTFFDLTNGVVGTNAAGNAASIEALANGWYRCIVTRTTANVTGYHQIHVASADNTLSYLGNITKGLYVWGAQLEAGSFATPPIPTAGSSATRAADAVTFSDLSWFDGSADSIYAKWTVGNRNNATVWAFDATNDKVLDEQTGMSARIAGATVGNTLAAAATAKVAARMALNDFAIAMNGGTVATDTSETAPGTLTASRIGIDLAGANSLNSDVQEFAAWKGVTLANAKLQALGT